MAITFFTPSQQSYHQAAHIQTVLDFLLREIFLDALIFSFYNQLICSKAKRFINGGQHRVSLFMQYSYLLVVNNEEL